MSLSEYAKLRKRLKSEDSKDSTEKTKDAENIDKESSKEIETVKETADDTASTKTVPEELTVDTNEPSTAAAATTAVAAATTAVAADRKLSVESHEVQELTKQRNKSGGPAEYSRFSLLTSISYLSAYME